MTKAFGVGMGKGRHQGRGRCLIRWSIHTENSSLGHTGRQARPWAL